MVDRPQSCSRVLPARLHKRAVARASSSSPRSRVSRFYWSRYSPSRRTRSAVGGSSARRRVALSSAASLGRTGLTSGSRSISSRGRSRSSASVSDSSCWRRFTSAAARLPPHRQQLRRLIRPASIAGALERPRQQRVRERLTRASARSSARSNLPALASARSWCPGAGFGQYIAHVIATVGQEDRGVPAPTLRRPSIPQRTIGPNCRRPCLERVMVHHPRHEKVLGDDDLTPRINHSCSQSVASCARLDADHIALLNGRQRAHGTRTSPGGPGILRLTCRLMMTLPSRSRRAVTR